LVDGAESGERVVTGLDQLDPEPGAVLIEHPAVVDGLLLLRTNGVEWVPASAFGETRALSPLDPLTPIARASSLPRGERIAGPERARALRERGTVLNAAFQLGMSEAMLDLAVEYAKTREQFARQIGSFQALKHMLADMFARKELARAAVYSAAAHLQAPSVGDAVRAVSSARVLCGQAAQRNARACIQIHGGIGYTWELSAHYYLKRCVVLETAFGSIDEHLNRVADTLQARQP